VAHTVFSKAAAFTKEFCHLSESTDEIMAEWMTMAGDTYAQHVDIKPGVREYLDLCRRQGQRCIVLTSSVPAHCRAGLHRNGLEPYFEKLLFAQELGLEKKDPEIFRMAARIMGVRPEDCTVFDDSVAACRGAKGAGMTTVGVHDDYFAVEEAEMRKICDRYIYSFSELMGGDVL
jgi:HAD superfamily hydrolase (TIGR01509 family)